MRRPAETAVSIFNLSAAALQDLADRLDEDDPDAYNWVRLRLFVPTTTAMRSRAWWAAAAGLADALDGFVFRTGDTRAAFLRDQIDNLAG